MTESQWLIESHVAQRMVRELRVQGKLTRTKAGKRKLRLFGCGCCRLIWNSLTEPGLREAVETAERFAEGDATNSELSEAGERIRNLRNTGYPVDDPSVKTKVAAAMALAVTDSRAMTASERMTCWEFPLAGHRVGEQNPEETLCDLIRCVFGNPFWPTSIKASWRTPDTLDLARAIYEDRAFDRMPILADALMDAGCDVENILAHCRSSGPHVRGCWVVDALLNEE